MPLSRTFSSLKSVAAFGLFASLGGTLASVNWPGEPIAVVNDVPVLDIVPADLNLGDVWMQKELPFELTLRNVSGQPVAVVDFTASCNCTEISPTRFTIPAFGSTKVRGLIDLTRSSQDARAPRVPFEVVMSAETEPRSESPLAWPLRGTALRVLSVSPVSVDLLGANEVVQNTWSPTVDIDIRPLIDLAELKPEWNANEADIRFTGPDADERYLLQYTLFTDQPVGDIDTRITLRSKLPDGSRGPEIEIPVRGVVVPPVRLSPDQVAVSAADPHPVQVHVMSANDNIWNVVEIGEQPDWLHAEVSPSGIALSATMPEGQWNAEPVTLSVVVASATAERQELEISVVPVLAGKGGAEEKK